MQAIKTKYHGPTNSKGSRIIASCEAGKLVMPYIYALSNFENHKSAAAKLAARLKWEEARVGGYYGTTDNSAYYWVAIGERNQMVDLAAIHAEIGAHLQKSLEKVRP